MTTTVLWTLSTESRYEWTRAGVDGALGAWYATCEAAMAAAEAMADALAKWRAAEVARRNAAAEPTAAHQRGPERQVAALAACIAEQRIDETWTRWDGLDDEDAARIRLVVHTECSVRHRWRAKVITSAARPDGTVETTVTIGADLSDWTEWRRGDDGGEVFLSASVEVRRMPIRLVGGRVVADDAD